MKSNINFRFATPIFLWGLAVSAVIVGEFAGWSEGLNQGGFGGMLVATLIASLMFGCLAATCSELATAIPLSGGAFAYTRVAFNPTVAFITGISQVIEYIATLAAVLAGIQIVSYNLFEKYYGFHLPMFGTWIFFIVIFAFLNIWDSRMFYRSALVLSLASLGALIFFCLKALPHFDINLLLDIPPEEGGTKWLPNGITGIAWCLPFAIWFFVVIEIITLAPEDTNNTKKALPTAFYASFFTILIFSLLVLFLIPGVGLGASDIAQRANPFRVALEQVTDHQLPAFILLLMVLSGPLAGYHSTVFAASKVISSLSRAGYFPVLFANISEKRQTPHNAIIFVSALVLTILVGINFFTNPLSSVPILLNMAILGAIISYAMTFISYISLNVNYPSMKRPYVSPLGVTGGVAGLLIAGVTTFLLFTNPQFVTALNLCLLIMGICLIYYYLYGKKNILDDSPEEALAKHVHSHHHSE